MKKPYKGRIYNWVKVPFNRAEVELFYGEVAGLGYTIGGYTTKTPKLGSRWRTSWVVRHLPSGWIETRNSRYKLVGKEKE